ncbi:MAG TPA: hypothetical protein VLB90_05745 [Pseudomonadales bacterium]|nr:hypothetical protein [Pseudomonadales bacterium]
MKKSSVLLAFAAAAIFSLPVMAGTNTPGLDEHEANLQSRLDEGLRTGALTPGEAATLQERINHLHASEAAAKKNGKASEQERSRLQQEAADISEAIHAKKHNGRASESKLDIHATREQERIDAGQKSGKLTAGEATELQERQDKLKKDEAAANADGNLTNKEREKLHKEEKKNSKAIKNLNHNERKD